MNSRVRLDWPRTVANSGGGGAAAMEGHTGTAAGTPAESAALLGFLWHDHPSPSSVQAGFAGLIRLLNL